MNNYNGDRVPRHLERSITLEADSPAKVSGSRPPAVGVGRIERGKNGASVAANTATAK